MIAPSAPRFFMLRARRGGALVPGRLWWCDFEPGSPANHLDRGRLSLYPRADIGGLEVPPEQLLDRLGIWRRRGDGVMLPHEVLAALADPAQQTPRPVTHWAYARPISEAEYRRELDLLRWREEHDRTHPSLAPRRAVAPSELPLPSFDRESSL